MNHDRNQSTTMAPSYNRLNKGDPSIINNTHYCKQIQHHHVAQLKLHADDVPTMCLKQTHCIQGQTKII